MTCLFEGIGRNQCDYLFQAFWWLLAGWRGRGAFWKITPTDRFSCLEAQDLGRVYLTNQQIEEVCQIDDACEQLLMTSIDKLKLTARSYHKLLKLARTIADMTGDDRIAKHHLAEAITYRRQEKHF